MRKGTSRAAMLTASFVALGVTAIPGNAFADTTSGQGGVLSGNQVNAPISAPVDVSGNAVAVAGVARGVSKGGTSVRNGGGGQKTSGKHGVASGNQVDAPISLPVDACGNAAAVAGKPDASCKGGSSVRNGGGGGQKTSGAHGVASGNQINAPISAPVNACGNAVAVFGKADAGCEGGSKVRNGGKGGQVTSGAGGVIAGNQVNAPISAPVNVCGNAAAILGDAVAGCEGGAIVKNGGRTGARQKTSGKKGVGSGNQANAPISAPVDACGNAVGNALAGCEGGASVRNGGHGTGRQTTNGDHSVLGGNQANAPISIPITACGNAGGVVGEAGAFCEGGAHARSSSGGRQHTDGRSGVLSGNQANAPVTIPVEACGNTAAVLGAAAASCTGQTLVQGAHGSGAHTSGRSGVGSGNQANAPVKAPADVCGNAAVVIGHAEAQCQGSGGGYQPYARTRGTGLPTPLNARRGLPSAPQAGKALPLSPGAALPVLPTLPKAAPKNESSLRTTGTRPGPGVTDVIPGTQGLPALNGLPGTKVVPGLPNMDGLTKNAGLTNPNGLPKVNGLPGTPVVPVAQNARTHGTPRPSLPAMSLPAVNGGKVPGLSAVPVTGHVKAPEVGGAGGGLGAVTPRVGALKPVAATAQAGRETGSGSLWVLGAAVMFAAMSGALSLTRRALIGRR